MTDGKKHVMKVTCFLLSVFMYMGGYLEIIYKKPSELTPYKNNPRDNDGAVDYVMRSIDSFGFKVPIVIDADGGCRMRSYETEGGKETTP